MWIRSQDKIRIINADSIEVDGMKLYVIKNGSDDFLYQFIGQYKTKERAIEILDEIQNELCLIHTSDIYKDESPDGIYDYSIVYQMPQD